MAFVRTIQSVLPGFGTPSIVVQRTNVTTNTGNTNVTLPATGSFSPSAGTGMIRVKSNVIGVNATCKVALITATDNTTTVQLYAGDAAASSAGVGIDEVFEFVTDLNLTSITVVVNVATNNCTHDVEFAGNP